MVQLTSTVGCGSPSPYGEFITRGITSRGAEISRQLGLDIWSQASTTHAPGASSTADVQGVRGRAT